jgi:hypothetical protein
MTTPPPTRQSQRTLSTDLLAAIEDRYQIERELGAGGMATVYLAHDARHDRKVAIKVLKPELAAVLGARNGRFARWSPDGNYIYYLNRVAGIDSIFRARVDRSPTVVVRAPELVMAVDLVSAPGWDIHPDGKRLIVSVPDLPIATAPSLAGPSRFVVILNWFTQLRQLTAAKTR